MFEMKVTNFCQRHELIKNRAKILIAVSGGPDSLALLHYLYGIKTTKNLDIVVGHVDHMFRGEQSYEDLQFVKQYCQKLNVKFEYERIDVTNYMKKTGQSSQVASRNCRYAFFAKVMANNGLDTLALGHHGDDQVETILMRLTRGSAGEARAGIPITRDFNGGKIIRPLLCVSKTEIEDYCSKHNLQPRYDYSNESDYYFRNRLRKEVLPALKRENNAVHEHFQRFSEDIIEDERLLMKLASENLAEVIEQQSEKKVIINRKNLLKNAKSLQRRMIQLILNYLYEDQVASLSATHVEQVSSLLENPHPSGTLHFPHGLYVIRSYNECIFQFDYPEKQAFYIEINEPGTVLLPTGEKVSMSFCKHIANLPNKAENTLIVRKCDVKLPLIIRTRQPGDRIVPFGMTGSKKTKEIFIEEKIPLANRDEWPVITDQTGTILWLPRLKKSALQAICDETTDYIKLTIFSTEK